MSAASRSFAIKPFNFLLVCNVVLGLGIRRVAYLQGSATLTLFAAQSAHCAVFAHFLHVSAEPSCKLHAFLEGRPGGEAGRAVVVMV